MPSYEYRCRDCLHSDGYEFSIGQAPRHLPCRCGKTADLVIGAGVQIAPSALETKGAAARQAGEREKRWNADTDAYRRMRHKGMQPKGVDGAAALEDKVGDQIDVDYHKFYDQGLTRERVLESNEQAKEIMANGLPL